MRIRPIAILLCLLLFLLTLSPAFAAGQTLSYEQLLEVREPKTVQVRAKTDEAEDRDSSGTPPSRTRWGLLVKDAAGSFAATGLYITAEQYRLLGPSERGRVLEHSEFTLDVSVDEAGGWTAQYGGKAGKRRWQGFFLPVLLLLLIGSMFQPKPVQTAHGTVYRPGKSFALLAFLNGIGRKDK